MPKVTVVILAHNAMTYLPETLNSVLAQTFSNNESCALVRRDCFEKVGGFDRTLTSAEDLDMWLRIAFL